VPDSLAIERELELFGPFRFNLEIDEVITASAAGTLVVDPVITHEFGIDDPPDAFATARNAAVSSEVLLRF
jgi:L-iditol 2-dehydrogenase/L-idonate 5-dehydrogenase